jgi:hypothetical protein
VFGLAAVMLGFGVVGRFSATQNRLEYRAGKTEQLGRHRFTSRHSGMRNRAARTNNKKKNRIGPGAILRAWERRKTETRWANLARFTRENDWQEKETELKNLGRWTEAPDGKNWLTDSALEQENRTGSGWAGESGPRRAGRREESKLG